MKAMVLAAGFGTRLRPLTDVCPKPLFPLVLQPMLGRVLGQLQHQGIREVVINLHHQAEQLARWLGDGAQWGMRLHLSYEPEILETAGGIKQVETLLHEAPFLVLNADVLIDLDFRAVWQWHCQRQAMVTMVLRPDPAARAYGAVLVDPAQRVVQINGRPTGITAATGHETVFTGVQVLSPEVLAHIPAGRRVRTTAEVYPALIAQGKAVYGYAHTGYWMDVGVLPRYLQAHRDILDGMLGEQWRVQLPAGSAVVCTAGELFDGRRSVTIIPPVVLGPGVVLAPGARIGPYAVLGAGCQIGARAVVCDSVLWERVHVAEAACIHRCILGAGVYVHAASVLSDAIHCILPS
jgi:NDP-sugar pyrophosphorylase family protein